MVEETKEKTERTKLIQRQRFVDELSCVYEECFGECPANAKLWNFSRSMFMLITELALEAQVSLDGIGTFTIHKSAPRKNSAEGVEVIPSLRFRPSTRLSAVVKARFGIEQSSDEEDEEDAEVLKEESESEKVSDEGAPFDGEGVSTEEQSLQQESSDLHKQVNVDSAFDF